ncbi:MAG: SUMF1/EgtB/PvdO family nonheme iron enzyme [Candidatus Binatia bacterium]
MGNHVFVCYARKDSAFVLKLTTNLKSYGVPVWLDQWDIPAGANYNRSIDAAIVDCAQFLVVLSPAAVDSVEVEGEWLMALEERKTIIPVLYRACLVPRQLRARHRVEFINCSPDDEALLARLVRDLGGSQEERTPTPAQPGHSVSGVEGQTERTEKLTIITSPPPLSEITNSLGMQFVLIPAGKFLMGSENEGDEQPVREVRIIQPFYMGKYLVTQEQWQTVMGSNPSHFEGELSRPVENVSWNNAQEFLRKLSEREKEKLYRLPTEAEWEYACRAGSTGEYCFGNEEAKLKEYAWYEDNSEGTPHPVGQLKPNAWGVHDVHGNVWEWVQDRYGKDYYQWSYDVDPQGPDEGAVRVWRGGAFWGDQRHARCACRFGSAPAARLDHWGFRVVVLP